VTVAPAVTHEAAARWDAWDRFVAATPAAGFMQSSWWAEFRTRSEFGHFATILRAEGTVVGGAVVLTYEYEPGYAFYYMPEGPVLPGDENDGDVFAAVLAEVTARRGGVSPCVSHLRIEPRWEQLPEYVQGFRTVPRGRDIFKEPRDTLCVDLRVPERSILARMKPKGRYNIGIAMRHGVVVVQDASPNGLRDFLSIYEATTDRHSLDAKPESYFHDLLNAVRDRGYGSLFFAEHQGTRLATALVIFWGDRATYFYGGSLGERRQVMAPYLLHFEIMRLAKARGCAWYDLWGVAPEDEPHHPWQQISVFKRKFGGREVRLVPTLDYVFDEAAYVRYLESRDA
jgi:lipid II:glycine glycyltransferase (peptidoglycan interpeptide bridge formation enzyme)